MIFYYKDKSVVMAPNPGKPGKSGMTSWITVMTSLSDFFDVFLFCLVFGPSFISLFGSGVVAVLV